MDYLYALLEGPDGSGKDTQALLLARALTDVGLNPLLVREPCDDLPTGRLLRQLLKSGEFPEAHAGLFMADRMALQTRIIKPAIEAGRPVVSIRSFLSTLAYQQENWPLDWLLDLHRMLPVQPSHVLILDIDPEEGMRRRTGRELAGGAAPEVYEKIEIQRRVRQRYFDLLSHERLRDSLPGTRFALVPGAMAEDVVRTAIWRQVVYSVSKQPGVALDRLHDAFYTGKPYPLPDSDCPHRASYEAGCPYLTGTFECTRYSPATLCPGVVEPVAEKELLANMMKAGGIPVVWGDRVYTSRLDKEGNPT